MTIKFFDDKLDTERCPELDREQRIMALKASASPNKDGMHTPAREADQNKNSLNFLRRNILTSTALRPRAVNHARICLNDSDISEIGSPIRTHRGSRDLDSILHPDLRPQFRRSAPQLDEIVDSMNNFNLGTMADAKDGTSGSPRKCVTNRDISSFGILRPSEMMTHFDASNSNSYGTFKQNINHKSEQQPQTNEIENLEMSCKSLLGNSSFDLSNFLSASHKFTPIRPNSLPAGGKLDNIEFKPADSSLVAEMFKRDEEDFQKYRRPFSDHDPNITFTSPIKEARVSWVSPEKRAQVDEKRLTIGEYFKLKSADIKELSQSLVLDPNESLGYSSYTVSSLPSGSKPEYIQSMNNTIDLTGNNTARGTFVISDTDSPSKNTSDLDSTLTHRGVNALSVSTIAKLLDKSNGCDTLVQNLIDLANKDSGPKAPTPSTPPSCKEANPLTPKRVASKLPRFQSKVPSKPVTPKGVKASGHLVCGEIKVTGHLVVAHVCSISVAVVNESADTLQCDLIDMADCPGYKLTSQAPVMLLSKRATTLQGTIVFRQPGEVVIQVGVKSMEIRSKKKSSSSAPNYTVTIEPQLYLKTPYKDGIDFGLRPEDTKNNISFKIVSLGLSDIPILISIEQDSRVKGYFLFVPTREDEDLKLSTCLAFTLPGSKDRKNATSCDIQVIFLAPSLESIPPNLLKPGDTDLTLRAKLVIEVEPHKGAPGLAPQERTILAQCPIEGRIGQTQLLVSHDTLMLIPTQPKHMGVKNGGKVPLDLRIDPVIMGPNGSVNETSILVEPSRILLIPGEEKIISLIWNADPDIASNFDCELHLMYNNLAEDHVVTLECRTEPPVIKEKLPLKSTRPHLAWGSIRPGETSKQLISFYNPSEENLVIMFKIDSSDQNDVPYKIFNENEEVTTEIELHLKPLQKRNMMLMFCPNRPGPSCAALDMVPRNTNKFHKKVIPLTGYGGHSKIVLKHVSTSHESSWLTLKPDFKDSVVGKFTLYNDGTLPAFVKITSNLQIPVTPTENSKMPMDNPKLTVTPDIAIVPARGSLEVSVKLSGVGAILSRTPSTEVKSLAVIHISTINEVTRRRLRRLIPTLSNKDLISFLKVENGAGISSLVEAVLDDEEKLVSSATLEQLDDYSGASASFLTKDLNVTNLVLKAEGTGAAKSSTEMDTANFVSMLDNTSDDTNLDLSFSSNKYNNEWGILTKELTLYFENNYKSMVQVTNYTDKTLSLEIICDDRLEVSEKVPSLSGYKTLVIFVSTKFEPQGQLVLEDGIVVYSKNDRIPIRVRVLPKPRHRMHVPLKKSLEPSLPGYSAPASPAPSTSSSSSGSSSRSWHSLLSGESSDEGGKSSGIYADSSTVVFPYTAKGQESMITLTLYNPAEKTKKVIWNPPGEPFWTTGESLEVQGKWHNYIRIYFKPTIARDITGILRLRVEGHPSEAISIQLQGLTDNH